MESTGSRKESPVMELSVEIPVEGAALDGVLSVPAGAGGVVLLATSEPDRRKFLAGSGPLLRRLLRAGFATLMANLLQEGETSGRPLVGTGPLNERIASTTVWLAQQPEIGHLPIGYYATEAAAAAAIQVSTEHTRVKAIVSRGGRLDLAFNSLPEVKAATLVLANQENDEAIAMGQAAYNMLRSKRKFVIVEGQADRPRDTLDVPEEVVQLVVEWFRHHLLQEENQR